MTKKNDNHTEPVIFRQCSYGLVKAITVYVGKTCKYRTITPRLMLFVIQALADMTEGKYRNRTTYEFTEYIGG